MEEIWKEITDYEDRYLISNLGRVKYLMAWSGQIYYKRELILKPYINKMTGYAYVYLMKNGKAKNTRVNRIVAKAFIPNPDNLPQVNHIDGNKLNNCVSNLEWCNASYNLKHFFKLKKGDMNNGK